MTRHPLINASYDSDYYYYYDDNVTLPINVLEEIGFGLLVYYVPGLIFAGCIGNIFSIAVFLRSKLRYQSTSHYLSLLALVDMIYLILMWQPWSVGVYDVSLFINDDACKIYTYVACVCNALSAWLVVAFTLERFIAIVYPLHTKSICTVKRARLISCVLSGVSLTINIPVIIYSCTSLSKGAVIYHMFVTFITFTPALIAIMIFNTCIVVSLYKSGQQHNHRSRERAHRRATIMLVTVSSLYVFLTLPAYLMQYTIFLEEPGRNVASLEKILRLLHFSNFGINFYIYCITGTNFRQALSETFPWIKCCRRNEHIDIV